MRKSAFTLIEVVISITIFMILVLFLYKTLDQTKHSNKAFSQKELEFKNINIVNDILFEDINESTSDVVLQQDRDLNTIVTFKTLNTLHNPFYNYITYLIDSKNSLVRMESKLEFKIQGNPFTFYNDVYVDELLSDVEFFEVKESIGEGPKKYLFVVKQKDKKREFFNIIKAFDLELEPQTQQTPSGTNNPNEETNTQGDNTND